MSRQLPVDSINHLRDTYTEEEYEFIASTI